MRSIFFLICLFCSSAAFSATYTNSSTVCTLSGKNALGHTRWYFSIIRASDHAWMAVANYTPSGANTADSVTLTVPPHTTTYDYYIVAWSGTTANNPTQMAAGKKWKWISAYEVGGTEPQASTSGPYDFAGNPTNDDGSPADPVTGSPPAESFSAEATLTNPPSSLENKAFRVTGEDASGVIFDEVISIAPGETRVVRVTNDSPFNLTTQEVLENLSFDPELSPGSPDGPEKYIPFGPAVTSAATGTTEPPPPGGTSSTTEKTAQAGSPSQPAAAKSSMSTSLTGATSKDLSDLESNLSSEIKRGVDQSKASGDSIRGGIDETNKILKDMKDGGSPDTTGGVPVENASSGSLSYIESIPGRAAGLGASLTNLLNAAGLGGSVGTASLNFGYTFPVVGSIVVDLDAYSDWIAQIRAFILWFLQVLFLWRVFSVIRGAFADES